MGRYSYSNRRTVERCKSITMKFLNERHGFDGMLHQGGISWSRREEKLGSVGFEVFALDGDGYVRFQFVHTDNRTGEKTEFDYKVLVESTPCYFGGVRWWFLCPLVMNGRRCNRRVGALYLGDGKYFGCRHCYNAGRANFYH